MDLKLTHKQAREFVIICRKLSNSEIDFINELADLGIREFAADLKARIELSLMTPGIATPSPVIELKEIYRIIDETLNAK